MAKRRNSTFSSFTNLLSLLNDAIGVSAHPASVVTKTASSLSVIMDSSKGRDRLLSIVQYSADLYKECMKDFIAANGSFEWPLSMRNAKSIKKTMSQGRKIFRLLKFMDEIVNVDAHWRMVEKVDCIVGLQCINDFFSFWYYVIDNVVWMASIQVISKYITRLQIKWKALKDSISLVRNVIDVLMCFIILYKSRGIESRLILQMKNKLLQQPITEGSRSFSTMEEILEIRREQVYRIIDLLQNWLRIVMLIQQLRLPGHQLISRHLVAVCGLVQSLLSVFKMMYEKPKLTLVERKRARTEVS